MGMHERYDMDRPPKGWGWDETTGECVRLSNGERGMYIEAVKSTGTSEAPRIGADRRWEVRWYESSHEAKSVRQAVRVATRGDAVGTLFALAESITETASDEPLPDLEAVRFEHRREAPSERRRRPAGGRQLRHPENRNERESSDRSRHLLREV